MTGYITLRSDGTPGNDRRRAVLEAVTEAANRSGRQVLFSVRLAITDAVIARLDDIGYLAPLETPAERLVREWASVDPELLDIAIKQAIAALSPERRENLRRLLAAPQPLEEQHEGETA